MQTKAKNPKPAEMIEKPITLGSWHGKDAVKAALKTMLSLFGVTLICFVLSLMLNFENKILCVVANLAVVLVGIVFLRSSGLNKGESDAAYAEIMYERDKQGKEVTSEDKERCFHPMKGFYIAMIAALPLIVITLVYALFAQPSVFKLGALPSWTTSLLRQTEMGDALSYYGLNNHLSFMDAYRIVDRALVMPYMSIATVLGTSAQTIAERLSPLLSLIAPLGYALGYAQGLKIRKQINTGIVIGVKNKRRKQRRERQNRQRKQPEQLI